MRIGMGQFKFFIQKVGDSLFHWTSYLGGVERISVLRESAFDYAISEVLEVNKHAVDNTQAQKDNNKPVIIDYTFRDPHPVFVKRSVDLVAHIQIDNSDTMYSEFKFVRRAVANEKGYELQRYFNDLFRLLAIQKKYNSKTKCLFFVIGKTLDFGECLKQRNSDGTEKIISRVLSFDTAAPVINQLGGSILAPFYSKFDGEYTYREKDKQLSEQDNLITRLIYKKLGPDKPVNVCIWEIECLSGVDIALNDKEKF